LGLERAVAGVQGHSGVLLRWHAEGPLAPQAAMKVIEQFASTPQSPINGRNAGSSWQFSLASGTESRLKLAAKGDGETQANGVWLAYTEVDVPQDTTVEFLGSSNGKLQVWLNGKSAHQREQTRSFQLDSDRFATTLTKGTNRLLVSVSSVK